MIYNKKIDKIKKISTLKKTIETTETETAGNLASSLKG